MLNLNTFRTLKNEISTRVRQIMVPVAPTCKDKKYTAGPDLQQTAYM